MLIYIDRKRIVAYGQRDTVFCMARDSLVSLRQHRLHYLLVFLPGLPAYAAGICCHLTNEKCCLLCAQGGRRLHQRPPATAVRTPQLGSEQATGWENGTSACMHQILETSEQFAPAACMQMMQCESF